VWRITPSGRFKIVPWSCSNDSTMNDCGCSSSSSPSQTGIGQRHEGTSIAGGCANAVSSIVTTFSCFGGHSGSAEDHDINHMLPVRSLPAVVTNRSNSVSASGTTRPGLSRSISPSIRGRWTIHNQLHKGSPNQGLQTLKERCAYVAGNGVGHEVRC
jgi:hypothetical protein